MTVHPLVNNKEFEVKWDIVITSKQPVNSYIVEIRIPGEDTSPGVEIDIIVSNSSKTSITHQFEIDGVDYSTANISVRVCAVNDEGETCSETEFFKGVEQVGGSPSGGISGGGIAAIIIVLVIFFFIFILVILLVLLIRLYFWRNYYPGIRGMGITCSFVH